MNQESQIIQEIDAIYQWLESELEKLNQSCAACGQCCDFESFGHKLYVTTPELINFYHFTGPQIKQMTTDICPYRIDGKCTVYPYRFSGCRIFTCKGDTEKENEICEITIRKFKSLCERYNIPYHYVYLKSGLEILGDNPEFKTQNL
jgi:hypothetical protein